MKPTKQQLKLSDIEETIRNRVSYLSTIERDIEAVSTAANNHLFVVRGEIEALERDKADLLRQNYSLEQRIRENKRLAEI